MFVSLLLNEMHKQIIPVSSSLLLCAFPRLMPFRPLFPCVPWSRGTNNITLK